MCRKVAGAVTGQSARRQDRRLASILGAVTRLSVRAALHWRVSSQIPALRARHPGIQAQLGRLKLCCLKLPVLGQAGEGERSPGSALLSPPPPGKPQGAVPGGKG